MNNNLPNMVPPLPDQNQQNNNINQNNQGFINTSNHQVETTNVVNPQQNTFINYNVEQNENVINDLNVEGSYNQLSNDTPYANDAKVIQNIEESKKKTVPISKELRTVIILALILLLAILFMPNISDFISGIMYN